MHVHWPQLYRYMSVCLLSVITSFFGGSGAFCRTWWTSNVLLQGRPWSEHQATDEAFAEENSRAKCDSHLSGTEATLLQIHFNNLEIGDYHQLFVVFNNIFFWVNCSRCELGDVFKGLSSAKRESVFDNLCVDVAAWPLRIWSSLQMSLSFSLVIVCHPNGPTALKRLLWNPHHCVCVHMTTRPVACVMFRQLLDCSGSFGACSWMEDV